MIRVTETKIRALPGLEAMLGDRVETSFWPVKAAVVAGWGAKRSGRRAERLAHRWQVPCWRLEDGFLRSYGTGDRFPPLSLVVDDVGIYYDATRASSLENHLASRANPLQGIEAEVVRAKQLLIQHELGKYNHAPPCDAARFPATARPRVLVVDQTRGDLSIRLGLASAAMFRDMLHAAIAENPEAEIYVKTHPEVSLGRKRGHLVPGKLVPDQAARITWLTDAVNPLGLLAHMDIVYVVTSQLGFEALLLGKTVHCFGLPWYAGWGATRDRQTCARRTRKRSVDELFAAAYFHYARYLNPETHERGTIFDVIDWLLRQREAEARWPGRLFAFGFRRWKAENLRPLLTLDPGRLHFVSRTAEVAALNPQSGDVVVHWGNRAPEAAQHCAATYGLPVWRIEDGFYRSVGLGSDLVPPRSWVVDRRGLYFDPSCESDLEHLLNHRAFTQTDLERARAVRRFIVDHALTKYNIDAVETPAWAHGGAPVILVPGQVEDDASIVSGCEDIRRNLDLLAAARRAHPGAFIVYKPHPDVLSGNRQGRIALQQASAVADVIETHCSIVRCLQACDEVHTMTSLCGFEALLHGKPVVVYGKPFYAGWGLTSDRLAIPRRERRLSLDELVAGALLHYPFYRDDVLRGYTTCESVLRQLLAERERLTARGELEHRRSGELRRLVRKLRALPPFRNAVDFVQGVMRVMS